MAAAAPLLVEKVKQVTVVTLNEGSVIDARLIESIREALTALVEKQARRYMIVDLTPVQYLSSAALGMLVPLQQAIEKRDGMLVLCGLRREIAKMFKLTGLHKLFTIRKNEKKALLDFGVTY